MITYNITIDSSFCPEVAKVCPLCGANRTPEEAKIAECYACHRDTFEDVSPEEVPLFFRNLHPLWHRF
jgi:hypothetical protein